MKRSAALFLLLAASAAQAHDIRQHAPHVHGQATVDVALDQQTLEFALQAPGIGILDYVRPPANAAEQAALARATTVLKGGSWVTLPTAAGCRLATGKADAEGFDATAAAPPGQHRHAGFSATLQYHCAKPAALRAIVVRLPVLFPGLHEVIVNSATANGQNRSVLTPDNLRVVLAP
ncbi:ZrgA family zinc uptake protein [Stenotrophomonas maltophilia]|uniref:ZrgA family zinc uptake protein n=1 Tax=Stenotrophomonas maltophilia TaxID=40324 RepID=UPI0039C396DF